jgi:hypothetical protein
MNGVGHYTADELVLVPPRAWRELAKHPPSKYHGSPVFVICRRESPLSTLRLATLDQRHFHLHRTPLLQLAEYMTGLDALCRTLGVTPLSRFVDITALEFAEASRLLPDTDAAPARADAETGLAWGIEDMVWFPISTGMTTLEALSGHLQRNRPREVSGANHGQLLEALTFCEEQLRPLEPEGGQFHLAAGH